MSTLFIKHLPALKGGTNPPTAHFLIARADGKATAPVEIRAPGNYPVASRPQSDLVQELRWYLEAFLEYPFSPNTDRAAHVLGALRAWGREAFSALCSTHEAVQLYEEAVHDGFHKLHVQVWSDDPAILGWPWEALVDPQVGFLAQTSAFERRLSIVRDPDRVSGDLPRDRVNILLVTARPYPQDVQFRSISRPLIDLIAKYHLPAHVHVLRPPTFARLRDHLRERPGLYHVLHFDGHGAYGESFDGTSGGACGFQSLQGRLVFEDARGNPDPITAETLSVLLREYAVPAVVLNACQSAMLDARAIDPFASVATALLRAGARSVVAMAYSLYVSAAQEFLPAFYRRLFETGSAAEAVRAGRQQLLADKKRDCVRGKFDLEDWLVPVLYEQDPLDFSFAKAGTAQVDDVPSLPEEAADHDNPAGFVGRDGELLALERALRGDAAAIVLHGLGGVGKTTLARGLISWLNTTDGLGRGCLWFGFQEIRSAEFVINRMGEGVFGNQFSAIPSLDQKIALLAPVLRAQRFIAVWDNFEVVAGVAATPGTLSADDRGVLIALLRSLRGGVSKVIITSRSEESWLGTERRAVPLGGLQGEERWTYCDRVLDQLGINVDRDDEAFLKLMDLLDGHPLAIRAIMPHLEKQSAVTLMAALRTNVTQLGTIGDEAQVQLFATLRFVEQSLPEALRPLLIPLALHDRFVDADYLETMSKRIPGAPPRIEIDQFCRALVGAGLLRDRGESVFEMHPVLTGYLRATVLVTETVETIADWTRAFVHVMAVYAHHLAPRRLHEQRFGFRLHGTSFSHALGKAAELGLAVEEIGLTQALAGYALHTRAYREAHELFVRLAELNLQEGSVEGEAIAYYQLGSVAQEQRNFAEAEQWVHRSLAILEKQRDEAGAAKAYHLLGIIAQDQRDFAAAERWYRKSLAIVQKLGDEGVAACTYQQLGVVAQEQRSFAAAVQWYRKSLAIKEEQGDEHGAAITYHSLGIVAQEQRDFAAAEQWYRKSLAIKQKLGDEYGAAITYHQLGIVAQNQRDFAAAEQWFRNSLVIKEKLSNESGAAITYHQLGQLAQQERDFAAAEQWYRKSLTIFEKQRDEYGAAKTYHMLGRMAHEQSDLATAEQCYRKSLTVFERQGDEYRAAKTYHLLGRIAQEHRDFASAEQWYRKSLVIEKKLDNEYDAAFTYRQFGLLRAATGDHLLAGDALIQAMRRFVNVRDEENATFTTRIFMQLVTDGSADTRQQLAGMWREAGFGELPPE